MPAALSFCLRRFFILVWPPAGYLFWMDKDFCEERVACGGFLFLRRPPAGSFLVWMPAALCFACAAFLFLRGLRRDNFLEGEKA
jgi:hypothetical protein